MTGDAPLALIDPGQLQPAARGVSASTQDRLSRAAADNTRTAYRRAWEKFTAWCERERRPAEPTDAATFTEYINHLINDGKSLPTCKQAISAIRKHHRIAGHEPPDLTGPTALLQAAGREHADAGRQQQQAVPVIVDALRKMIDTCQGGSLIDTRDHAMLTLGIAIFARRSELTGLNMSDLRDAPEGLTVRIRKSKTDRQSRGMTVPVLNGAHPGTDPVRAVARWREALASRGVDHGRLFRSVNGARIGPSLTGTAINEIIQARAGMAGLGDDHAPPEATDQEKGKAAGYSAHSLRAGAATIAYMNGAPVAEICRLGRWAPGSSVVLRYIRAVDQWKNHPFRGVL